MLPLLPLLPAFIQISVSFFLTMGRGLFLYVLLSLAGVHAEVSKTGRCGTDFRGLSCTGSTFGNCCSSKGWCGTTSDHCEKGCQSGFGICKSSGNPGTPGTKPISKDARCGSQHKGQTCQGSVFGNCCSQYGYVVLQISSCWALSNDSQILR